MKISSCMGDEGLTSISGGKRLPKHHPRIEALGSIDELISWIGLLRDYREIQKNTELLVSIQKQLMLFNAALASESEEKASEILVSAADSVNILESAIESLETTLPGLRKFIIPGGNILVSYVHITRNVCRRAERRVVKLDSTEKIPPLIIKYLNRLADYLFLLGRKINLDLDIKEIT
ncbi:MAG: cob(I)yrinic acid a,c-diamide adenosyltransferase [Bacteroidales bacterium]|jgi:cob(I)alamin adenosyltransferase|nr:cob(I)yrinic acid a,c-diamide adenosyltransferase [Bacteroidales bacterium]